MDFDPGTLDVGSVAMLPPARLPCQSVNCRQRHDMPYPEGSTHSHALFATVQSKPQEKTR
jgi:hypothetical protein